jgi:hypothetical protein
LSILDAYGIRSAENLWFKSNIYQIWNIVLKYIMSRIPRIFQKDIWLIQWKLNKVWLIVQYFVHVYICYVEIIFQ